MGKLKTVTVDYDGGQLTITGYYSRAYSGTSETPPEPSMFEVTEAIYSKHRRETDISHVPSNLLAEGVWDYIGGLACSAVEQRKHDERMAYAERDEA